MHDEPDSKLPEAVCAQLPKDAQETYRLALNGALRRYGRNREAVAHRIAWAAVERSFVQRRSGQWVRYAGLA